MTTWFPSNASRECLTENLGGKPYEEFACLYPQLKPFYTSLELNYDPVPVRDWMCEHNWVPILACTLYGVGILFGRRYFADKDRWNWRYTLAAWNLGLSLFSLMGVLRTAPWLAHIYSNYSMQQNFCFDPESHYGSGSNGLWVQLFVLSKFPELIDTFFIVIHKKPLIFLHWYHHISVLLYCWHSYVYKAPAGILFCVMNYSVHSIMYFYYFLMAMRIRPSWLNPMLITIAQITQMIFGVAATVYSNYLGFVVKPEGCHVTLENNVAALVMYGSYLALFLEFFFGRYFGTKKAKPSKQPANGHTNGVANGKTNGATNGHANGKTNGATNGHTNGAKNGHTNGKTNGATTNGKTNGAATNGSSKKEQ